MNEIWKLPRKAKDLTLEEGRTVAGGEVTRVKAKEDGFPVDWGQPLLMI